MERSAFNAETQHKAVYTFFEENKYKDTLTTNDNDQPPNIISSLTNLRYKYYDA